MDIQAAARLINPNTVLLVGSAPNFPHGIVDDISALSRLALRRNGGIPLHVDCCLGSFMMPFLEKVGFETTPFDFRVRGVTSISVDTHKYGFAPKGNSTLLFRTAALRSHAYFVSADWAGGVYASPGMAGSRPGALIAGCWATLVSVGEQGYADACREIVGAAKATAERIATSPVLCEELEIIGRPLCSVIAFKTRPLHHATSPSSSLNGSLSMDSAAKTPELVGGLNIYHIADAMVARGWHLNALQNPPGIHVAFTIPVARRWEALVADLEAVVAAERERKHALEAGEVVVSGAVGEEAEGLSNGPNRHGAETKTVTKKKAPKDESAQGDITALYGVAGSLPNKSVVVDLASGFLDLMLTA